MEAPTERKPITKRVRCCEIHPHGEDCVDCPDVVAESMVLVDASRGRSVWVNGKPAVAAVNKPRHRVAICVQCGLLSHPGLPPFKSMRDLEGVQHYYHEWCPPDPEEISAEIEWLWETQLERGDRERKTKLFREPRLRGAPWR